MKKRIKIIAYVMAAVLAASAFSGCQVLQRLTNKVPENFTEGVKYDRDFPDDILEIYDDAVVYKSMALFDELVVFAGTEDDFDDIVEFYKELFEDIEAELLEETEDRDEYIAVFLADGWKLRIHIKEADGEYVEDLFEYVIIMGAKEAGEDDMKAQATAAPAPTDDGAAPTPAPEATPAPAQTSDTFLSTGSWTVWDSSEPGIYEGDINFEILDGTKGVMYYFNVEYDEIWRDEFTYTFINGILTFSFFDGSSIEYEAAFDEYDYLECTSTHDPSLTYTYYNWNEFEMIDPSPNNFPALGCWIYYEPASGYVETVSFWDNGLGMFYNTGSDIEYEQFTYSYSDYTLTMNMLDGTYQYQVGFRGNVMEFSDEYGNLVVFSRVGPSVLAGTYELYETSEEGIDTWTLTLYPDQSGVFNITIDSQPTEQDIYWDTNNYTGMLSLYASGDNLDWHFLYTAYGLMAENTDHTNYYKMMYAAE